MEIPRYRLSMYTPTDDGFFNVSPWLRTNISVRKLPLQSLPLPDRGSCRKIRH